MSTADEKGSGRGRAKARRAAGEGEKPATTKDPAPEAPEAAPEAFPPTPPSAAPEAPPAAGVDVGALSRRALAAVVVVIVVFAAGVAAWPFLLPRLGVTLPPGLLAPDPALVERVAALEARLAEGDRLSRVAHGEIARLAEAVAALETRLGRLEGAPVISGEIPGMDRLATEIDALGARLEALESMPRTSEAGEAGARLAARLGALERALAAAEEAAAGADDLRRETVELDTRVEGLSGRLAALEEVARAGAGREAGLVALVGQLGEALRGPGPYAGALAAVAALAAGDAALAPPLAELAPYAEAGVATLDRLRARFAAAAGDIVAAEASDARTGWWGDVLDWLSALIKVRRTGEVEGDTAEARVARAERRLEAGDLDGAVAEIDALEGAAAAVAAAWLEGARARLAAEGALAALRRQVVAGLGGTDDRGR